MKSKRSDNETKPAGRRSIGNQEQNFKKATSRNFQDIQEAIQLKAYQLYIDRGGRHGKDLEDWFIAERIILQGTI